jgi:hypothetical protein
MEHGGMLLTRSTLKGTVVLEYIEPTPEGNPTSVTVIDRKWLETNLATLVGTYHVHLCMTDYYHQYFSVQDVVVAILSGVPEFMLDECTGEIHEFDPMVDKVHDTGIDGHLMGPHCELLIKHIPSGRIIANLGETEPEHAGPAVDNNLPECAHEASWAIQGIYSQLDCSTQPGAHPWYVMAAEHRFFMGCRNG